MDFCSIKYTIICIKFELYQCGLVCFFAVDTKVSSAVSEMVPQYAVFCPEGDSCKFRSRRIRLVNHLTASSAHEMRAAKANEFAKSDYWITAEENDDDRSRSLRPSVKQQLASSMLWNTNRVLISTSMPKNDWFPLSDVSLQCSSYGCELF